MLRGRHHELLDARGARRHGAHDDRGGIRRPAAGRVDRRAARGPHAADPGPPERHLDVLAEPRLGDAAHVGDRRREPRADLRVEGLERRRQLRLGHAQRQLTAAEAPLELEQARVAGAHGREDLRHRRPPTPPPARARAGARRRGGDRASHGEALNHTDASRTRPSSSSSSAALSLCATGLAISRAVEADDLLAHHEAVLAQRRAGRREVDDPLDQPGQRRQLDRALDLDDLRLAARALEVAPRDPRVLGRDAHHAEPAQRLRRRVLARDGREHHPHGP